MPLTNCPLLCSFMVIFVFYVVGGVLYNRYVLDRRGFDQIPRLSFFSCTAALDYCSDLSDRLLGSRARRWHERTGGSWPSSQAWGSHRGFERLSTLPEEAEPMTLGRDSEEQSTGDERGSRDIETGEGDAHIEEPRPKDIAVVHDFSDVFPKELPRLPPEREIKFVFST